MLALIEIHNCQLPCSVGVYEKEKRGKCTLSLSLSASVDISQAVASDSINDTVDYDRMVAACTSIAKTKHYHLLETLAHALIKELFNQFPQIKGLKIHLKKPHAIVNAEYSSVFLELSR